MATHRCGAEAPSILHSFHVTKGEECMHEERDMVVFFSADSLAQLSQAMSIQCSSTGIEL